MAKTPTYVDGDFTEAQAISLTVKSAPFPRVNQFLVLTQDFRQNEDDFTPLDFNTPHDDFPTFLLVHESELQDLGNGVVKWTRTYVDCGAFVDGKAVAPCITYEDAGTINFTFPGINPELLADGARNPLTMTVTARIVYEYFLTGAGQEFESPADIPVIPQFQVLTTLYGLATQNTFLLYNGLTNPDATEYKQMITDEDEIVAQDSNVSQWQGNIFQRITHYIKAQ